MNSDAANAKKAKNGRGERRYLRLGREDSMQLPGEESWLDELEDDEAVEVDEEEGRRLVGSVLEGWEDEGCTVLGNCNDTYSMHYHDLTHWSGHCPAVRVNGTWASKVAFGGVLQFSAAVDDASAFETAPEAADHRSGPQWTGKERKHQTEAVTEYGLRQSRSF